MIRRDVKLLEKIPFSGGQSKSTRFHRTWRLHHNKHGFSDVNFARISALESLIPEPLNSPLWKDKRDWTPVNLGAHTLGCLDNEPVGKCVPLLLAGETAPKVFSLASSLLQDSQTRLGKLAPTLASLRVWLCPTDKGALRLALWEVREARASLEHTPFMYSA